MLIFLLLSLTEVSDSYAQKVFEYTEKKKSPTTAVVLSFFLPSTGHFYANENLWGLSLLGTEIFESVMVAKLYNNDTESDEIGWLFALIGTRILEFVSAASLTNSYNDKLKKELGLKTSLKIEKESIGINIALRFY